MRWSNPPPACPRCRTPTPMSPRPSTACWAVTRQAAFCRWTALDRKSTRLNSSHLVISYAVFCLKKKKHYASDETTRWENILPYLDESAVELGEDAPLPCEIPLRQGVKFVDTDQFRRYIVTLVSR